MSIAKDLRSLAKEVFKGLAKDLIYIKLENLATRYELEAELGKRRLEDRNDISSLIKDQAS